jgi:enamine deaminase RidA (YjgF/YER057c/UK114 family)
MAAQVRAVLDNGAAILEAAGLTFRHVVSSRVFITDAAQFQAMNTAYRTAFPEAPPARATVICDLMGSSFLVEVTMIAVADPARRAVATTGADGTPRPANPNLSAAIVAGDRLFVSGMLGNTPENRQDLRAQTRETLAALGRTLKAGGSDWSRVTDAIVYLTDVSRAAEIDAAWKDTFGTAGPARTVIGTGLVAPDGLIEIMINAVR